MHGCPLKYTCNYNFVQIFFQAWLAIWMKLGQGNGSNMAKETQFLSIRKIWRIKAPVIDANMTNTSSKIRKYLSVFKIHRGFLEHWNSQKSLCSIWQCFSCLLYLIRGLQKYHISSYSFRGNYSFLNLEIVENSNSYCKFQFST